MQRVMAKSAPIWSIKEGHFIVVVKDKESIAYKESDLCIFEAFLLSGFLLTLREIWPVFYFVYF